MTDRQVLAWLGLLCSLGTAGCRGKTTPEAACEQLQRAISEGDASQVFDSLLQTTQWSFYTVVKNHQAMRELVRKSYPAEQQETALQRLYGAEASSGRDLFIRIYADRYEKDFTQRLGSGPMQVLDAAASDSGAARRRCQRQQGQPFLLQVAASGKWGMSELEREWDEAKLRTFHDLATVQKNAELYDLNRGGQPSSKRDKQP